MNSVSKPKYGSFAVSAFSSHFANGWSFSLFTFALGVLSGITVNPGGKFYLGEIFGIFYLFFGLTKKSRLRHIPRAFILLAFLWSLSQIFSDVVNYTAFLDSVKGVLTPLIFIATISGLCNFFVDNSKRFPSYLIGLPLGLLIDLAVLNPTPHFLVNNQWKWGYGGIVSQFFIIILSFYAFRGSNKSFDYLSILIFAGLSLIGLANDSRGALGLLMIYCLFAFQRKLIIQRFLLLLSRLKGSGTWMLIMGAMLFLPLFSLASSFILLNPLAASIMPEATYEKTVKQSQSSFGILLGGRSEILTSFEAFADKPLLGHGSWAKDHTGAYNASRFQRALDFGEDIDVNIILNRLEKENIMLIPTHSFIMGAFVWSGVFGGLFWVYLLYWLATSYLRSAHVLNFYYFHGIIILVWDIFYSPFAYSTRFSAAVFLASLIAFFVMFPLCQRRLCTKG